MMSLPALSQPATRPAHGWQTTSAEAAAALIRPGATVGVGWLGDNLAAAMEAAFLARSEPRSLTIMYATTLKEGRTHGLNRLAHAGLVRRVISGQWYPVPALQALARANRIEAYSLPAGIIRLLFRDIAAGRPGHLTRIGIGTFADPRNGGGRLNSGTREDLARVVRPASQPALLFRSFPIDVAIVAVSFVRDSDTAGMTRDAASIAHAARSSGGLVIAQADPAGTLDHLSPGQIEVPKDLIDLLITDDPIQRRWEMFAPGSAM